VTELAKALGAPRAYVRLGMDVESAPDDRHSRESGNPPAVHVGS
jgi:hypothetical protein